MSPAAATGANSLDEILSAWREEAATSTHSRERIKGTAFERLCIAYLTHDPTQKTQYEPPVRFGAWARGRGLPEMDVGIDLVAKIRGGGDGVRSSASSGLKADHFGKQQ